MNDTTTESRLESKFSVDGSLLVWNPEELDAWIWSGSPAVLVDSTDEMRG